MPIGLGAGGSVGIAPETTYGTYTATGIIWVPVLSENLIYQEDRYYSQALRGQAMDNEVKQGYYHVEGDIEMEVDTRYLPYWLGAARLTRVKTVGPPATHTFTPNGSASGAASAWTNSLSISIVRNGVVFGYAGCVVTSYSFNVGDDGVLKFNAHVIGASEATQSPGAVTFAAPRILGASTSTVKTGAGSASTAPTLATDINFDTFAFEANDNGAAQSRIGTTPARAAAYISLGKGEIGRAHV